MSVNIDVFFSERNRLGAIPSIPSVPSSEVPPVLNPPGSPIGHDPVTLGTPANGLSLSGQELSLGLASASTTGALSSTDWNTFNGKIGGSGTVNFVPKFTGSGTIGNSTIFESANGEIGIGSTTTTNYSIRSARPFTGSLVGFGITSEGQVRSDVTSSVRYFQSQANLQPTAFTIAELYHFFAGQTALSGGASIGSQYGLYVSSNLTGATNTFAIRSDVAAGTNRWNLYMAGSANNYLAGNLWIGTTSGTNTLDINGTTRIRTINNLGTAATSVLVPSATGVVSLRTLAELASDGGFANLWTLSGSDIYRNSKVTIGQTSIISADLGINQTVQPAFRTNGAALSGGRFTIQNVFESTNERYKLDNWGIPQWLCYDSSTPSSRALAFTFPQANQIGILTAENWTYATGTRGYIAWNPTNTSGTVDSCVIAVRNNVSLGMTATGRMKYGVGAGYGTGVSHSFSLISGDTTNIGCYGQLGIYNTSGVNNLNINQTGDIQIVNASGIKIGTATSQKLSFWNATPIVQPTNAIAAAAFVANTSGIANDTATFGGYTIGQVVQALRNIGLLA